MATIVEYTDRKTPRNGYPRHIISPSHAGPCCFSEMEWLDAPQVDVRWRYQYRRCRRCGFAVRVILHEIPNAALVNSLREELAHSFVRNLPA